MQVIRQQDRTVMPTGESPNVTLNPNMFAGEAAAAQRLAGAVQQFGGVMGDIGLKMQDAEVEREVKDFQIKANEAQYNDETFYQNNDDDVITPEVLDENGNVIKPAYTKYQDQHDKSMKSLEVAASSLKYGKARTEAQQWLKLNKPLLQHGTDQYIKRESVERALATHQSYVASILSSNQSLKADEFNSFARKNSPGSPEFVKRMGQNTIPPIQNEDGTISTHRMISFEEDGKFYAAPTIVNQDGKLVQLTNKEAISYALKNKEYAEFATEKDAQKYAEGSWKQGDMAGAKYPTKPLTENEYKLAQIKIANDSLVKRNFLTPVQAQTIYDEAAKNLQKTELEEVKNTTLGLATSQRNKETGRIDLVKAQEVIKKSKLSEIDQLDIMTKLDTWDTKEQKAKEDITEAERKTIDDIFIKPTDEFLASVPNALDAINNSANMPVKDKEEQRKKINDRVNAIKEGKIDPVDTFDPQAYNNLAIRISKNSKAVSAGEIENSVGKGKKGGITVKQKEALFDLKKKYDSGDIIGNRLHSRYSDAVSGLRTSKAFSLNKVENVKLAAEAQSVLDSWAIKHPDATEDEYEDFFNRLVDTSNLSGWYTFFTRKSKEQRTAIQENLKEMKTEIGDKPTYTKGQKIDRNGKKYIVTGFDTDGEPLVEVSK